MKTLLKGLLGIPLVASLSFTGTIEGSVNRAFAACDFIKPAEGSITSKFRPPHRPNHHGIDIAKSGKVSIKASAKGTVSLHMKKAGIT